MTLLLPTLDVIAGLQPEEEQEPEKKVEVERTPELERILKGFEAALPIGYGWFQDWERVNAPENQSASVITQASIALSYYSNEKCFDIVAGAYLSALINKSPDLKHQVFTASYRQLPHYLAIGLPMDKKLTIVGSVGHWVAYESKGFVAVEGNTGFLAGLKNYGNLVIRGNAYLPAHNNFGIVEIFGESINPGYSNKGTLVCHGPTRGRVGINNTGTIQLQDTYEQISEYGTIFHKGIPIVLNGRRV